MRVWMKASSLSGKGKRTVCTRGVERTDFVILLLLLVTLADSPDAAWTKKAPTTARPYASQSPLRLLCATPTPACWLLEALHEAPSRPRPLTRVRGGLISSTVGLSTLQPRHHSSLPSGK